jgi:hypothetical protein
MAIENATLTQGSTCGASERIATLPREAVDTVLQEVASTLYNARALLLNDGDAINPTTMGVLAMIERAGALVDSSIQSYGGHGVTTPDDWLHSASEREALVALAEYVDPLFAHIQAVDKCGLSQPKGMKP